MSEEKKRKPHFLDEYDNGEYLGNIFGWKVSFIGLAVILLLMAIIWFRSKTFLPSPPEPEKTELPQTE